MGAWDFGPYRYTVPRMGRLPVDNTREDVRVNRAVHSIQVRLKELGFDPHRTDGVFGFFTGVAVRQFQRSIGLKADGAVGRTTMGKLLYEPIIRIAERHDVPIEYLAGVVIHESGLDPAATHLNDASTAAPGSVDRGLVQINDQTHPEVRDRAAFTAKYALRWEAEQMGCQHDAYVADGAGEQRAWDAAIMYNLSPSSADAYAAGDNSAPSDKAFKFVRDVKAYGEAFFA